ncbi:serine/threonine-protein phosphatase 7 long form homolog [Ipomoea triloba]|uniref:serine/threonine-protein phosphatase 7 long form homolog n=1 Tax=Ipomoea triloba TaxID=35885 RepID=UPI00125D273C|nr:serine/threonine-protein phosphatase 7 long form homolog [Ipomoea triloba]XP_031091193.1 serine/threonine-protein phosphatase 7 long form homolog [Ipomoea triloba]
MVLLQLWAWERLPMVRPQSVLPVEQLGDLPLGARWVCSCGYRNVTSHVVRTYRDQLDRTYERNFEFTPYDLVMPILPDYCKAGARMWTAEVPLIFYFIVEHHYPDRFCRQFSGFQDVPRPVQYRRDLHGTNGRTSKKIVNWAQKHFDYLEAWYNWEDHVIQMQEPSGEKKVSDAYISWYLCCGRRQIGKPEISSSYTELAYGLLWVGRRGRRALDNPNPAEIEQARREVTERIEQLLEGVEASPYAYLLHVPDEILNTAPNPYEPIQDNRRNLQRESEQLER